VLLTALAVLGGVVAVLHVFSTAVTEMEESRAALKSNWLLREKMAAVEMDASAGRLPAGDSQGGFSGADAAFRWRMNVSPVSSGPSGAQLSLVQLAVWRTASPRSYSVSTYANPAGVE
jgi:hypothetical protein